jgi:hypothetical protein
LLSTNPLVEPLGKLFSEILPGVRIVNLVDDSLLADVRAAGCVTPSVRRMIGYGVAQAQAPRHLQLLFLGGRGSRPGESGG